MESVSNEDFEQQGNAQDDNPTSIFQHDSTFKDLGVTFILLQTFNKFRFVMSLLIHAID